MKRHRTAMTVFVVVALVAFALFTLAPSGVARAQASATCVHAPTIDSLEGCVRHAAELGHINNKGVARSLLAKLDAAEAALRHHRVERAIDDIEAFIHEVHAQSGKHIEAMHATELIMHAQLVIDALRK